MQQELAVSLSDLDLLTFTLIGKGIFDDGCVILVDDICLGVTGGKDKVAMNRDQRTDECRHEDIFVIDNCGVDLTECYICCDLAFSIILFSVNRIWSVLPGEVTRNLLFSLRVCHRYKLGRGNLLIFLTTHFQGAPAHGVGSRWYWGSLCGSGNSYIGRTGVSVGVGLCLVSRLLFLLLFWVLVA